MGVDHGNTTDQTLRDQYQRRAVVLRPHFDHWNLVSTVGRDEELIRNYIRHQEQEDERLDQLGLWR